MFDVAGFDDSTGWAAGHLPDLHVPHTGYAWPAEGGDPFALDHDEPREFFYAHRWPSRTLVRSELERLSLYDDVAAAIPMGYTNLLHLEKVAVASDGELLRFWVHEQGRVGEHAMHQPFQAILPGKRYLQMGTLWPIRFAVADAVELSARTRSPVLLAHVVVVHYWH